MKTIFSLCLVVLFPVTSLFAQWVPITGNSFEKVATTIEPIAEGFVLTLDLPGFYKVQDELGLYSILLPDGVNETEAGFPDMQHLAVSVQIPALGIMELRVRKAEYTEIDGLEVAPAKGDPQFSHLPGWHNPQPATLAYENNMFYPPVIAKAGRPYILGGVRGQSLKVFPLGYHPLTHTLRVCHHLELELHFTDEPGVNELSRQPLFSKNTMAEVAENHFLNGSVNERYQPVAEDGGMLIITPSAYVPLFDEFIQWKAQCGVECTLITAEELPDVAGIQQKIKELYYSRGLSWLLLAGDMNHVPSVMGANGMGDNMYGYIEGDDHYPEIITARMPAKDAGDLKVMLSRSLNYEKGLTGFNRADAFAGIASELGPGDNGEKDYEHMRIIGQQLQQNCGMTVSEFYDGSQGGNDQPGNPRVADVEKAFNAGLGTVMYIGHGTSGGWHTSGFNSTHVKQLTNTASWPVIWSAGCDNGNFSEANCFAAHWLKAGTPQAPAGAVAAMMSTGRQSWFPPMSAQDEVAAILGGKKPGVTTRTFGGISMAACMRMNDKYGEGGFRVTDTWNLFGDPSLMMRTATARKMETSHPAMMGADDLIFEVNVSVEYALATLVQHGKLLGAARVLNGVAGIPLPGQGLKGEVVLTITAYNHMPCIDTIEVINSPAIATQPFPHNHSKKVSPYADFQWDNTPGITPAFYEIFIATHPDGPWSNANITFESRWQPELPLAYLTTYYWKVVSHHANGSSESAVFDFTTGRKPDEDFEQAGFSRNKWLNSGDREWFTDNTLPFEGNYSLRSGEIQPGESSRLAYECITFGCDVLSFRVKVSSQPEIDKLLLRIDNEIIDVWSGEIPWQEVSYSIEAGNHLIEWVYVKGNVGSSGADAAWLDNIYLPENKPVQLVAQDKEACAKNAVQLDAAVAEQAWLKWESDAGGWFEDASAGSTLYYPTQDEIQAGQALVRLIVFQNGYCDPVIRDLGIQLHSLPLLPGIKDTLIYAGESLEFILPRPAGVSYFLSPEREISGNTLRIDDAMLDEGDNQFVLKMQNHMGCVEHVYFTVTLIRTNRPHYNSDMLVYPNPAKDNITIANLHRETETVEYEIYSITGRFMGKFSPDMNASLDVSAMPAGIYILKAIDGLDVKHARFIKQI